MMKKSVLFTTLILFFSLNHAWCEEDQANIDGKIEFQKMYTQPEDTIWGNQLFEPTEYYLSRIDKIEIGVETCEIRMSQQIGDDEFIEKTYPAATASLKNARDIPYKRIGYVTKIVFNPSWTPTKKIREELIRKSKGKKIPKTYPPGKNNPLGIVKIFIEYENGPYVFGIHNTNAPNSIGKRETHGCSRLSFENSLDVASIILRQNDIEPEKVIEKAKADRKRTLTFVINKSPSVTYLEK